MQQVHSSQPHHTLTSDMTLYKITYPEIVRILNNYNSAGLISHKVLILNGIED
jgi:hypothetical protein